MTIDNRNLEAGTKLAARYKAQTHTVLVLKDDEGKLGFELDNGTIYKSLSKAGSAVMNGTACNGCPCGMELHTGTRIRCQQRPSFCAAQLYPCAP